MLPVTICSCAFLREVFPVPSKLLQVKGRGGGSKAIVSLDPAVLPGGIFGKGGTEGMLGMLWMTEGSALWLQIQVSSATPPSPRPTRPG